MLKPVRSPLILSAVIASSTILLPLLVNSAARAQERQGCFVIDSYGQVIDLGSICPSSTPTVGSSRPLGTGDIQATLRWSTTDDLDLAVTDPSSEAVNFSNRRISSGGQLDVDANANCIGITRTPIENVFWPPSQAPQGSYTVSVNLFTRCGSTAGTIPFTLTLLVQGTTRTLTGSVSDQNPTVTFPFSLPLAR